MSPAEMRGAAGAPAILLALLAWAAACGPGREAPPGSRRLVVVGVDGATWKVASPLMAAGRMPHLARLYRAGSAGALVALRSPAGEPLPAPALWTSVVTGRAPQAHGIFGPAEKVPGRYALRPSGADRRLTPALWTIAGSHGLAVGVAGWPVTFPAERVNGYLIADGYDPPATGSRGYLHPADALGEGSAQGEALRLSAGATKVASLDADLADSFRRDLASLSRGLALYRVYQPGLAFFRFESLDLASHRFWQYHDTRYLQLQRSRGVAADPEREAALAEAIPGSYAFFDDWLGELLERVPENATLIVLSPYGFRGVEITDHLHLDMESLLERIGRLSRRPDGAVAWETTRLFDLDASASSRRDLFVNVKGREEEGSVEPAAQETETAAAVALLSGLATEGGERLFSSVGAVSRPGAPGPDIEAVENLQIDPNARILLRGSREPVTSLYRRYSEDFGTHDPVGLLLAAGAGVAAGRTGWSAGLDDVAPTLLRLLGLPAPPEMPGASIEAILLTPPPSGAPPVAGVAAPDVRPGPVRRPEAEAARELARQRALSHLR